MENAAEALKMAGAVMLFVLALSIILFSFGQVRESADAIINYRDRETAYINANYYYEQTGTERYVSLETVIPAVFRAYLENYKIVFDGLDKPIYRIKNKNGDLLEKYTLDLETNKNLEYNNVVLADNEQKIEFIKKILYGSSTYDFKKMGISFENCESLYDQLKGKKVIEYLGVYYQNDSENVPDVNKTKKRIITYKIQ